MQMDIVSLIQQWGKDLLNQEKCLKIILIINVHIMNTMMAINARHAVLLVYLVMDQEQHLVPLVCSKMSFL